MRNFLKSAPRPMSVGTFGLATLMSLVLVGCDSAEEEWDQGMVDSAEFYRHTETGLCLIKTGYGNTMDYDPVDCTPEVLAQIEAR